MQQVFRCFKLYLAMFMLFHFFGCICQFYPKFSGAFTDRLGFSNKRKTVQNFYCKTNFAILYIH